jgi:ribosomal protein S18 acetylase RimI-like enzyme
MIGLNMQIRRAQAQDHRQISSLIFHEANTHRHLDWHSVLEWIGGGNYWVLEENGLVTAAFACPEEPPNVAWIRLFAHHPRFSASEAWSALWETARADIYPSKPQAQVAAIVLKQWFQNLLVSSGFENDENVVLLRLNELTHRSYSPPRGLRIRLMRMEDLPFVAEVDFLAFGSFWHNTLDALQRAYAHVLHATVAEDDSGVIAYQLSTGNAFGAHLARLGVKPEAQGRGVASALVVELVRSLGINSTRTLSVNTQSKNAASLALYRKLGFTRTGEHFPLFVYPAIDGQ